MMYIDQLLLSLITNINDATISSRDIRILKSLSKSIGGGYFLTEKQGNLLLRILTENNSFFKIDEQILKNPIWSHPFRYVDKTRRMFISTSPESQEQVIAIEFTFASSIRKAIVNLNKKLSSSIIQHNNGKYFAELTETNIVILVDELLKLGFEIDSKIQDFYDTITSWNVNDYIDQYQISTISYPNFKKHLTNDLGINTPLNSNIIADRSIRYQYFIKDPITTPNNLTDLIANRLQPKIWIDRKTYTIDGLISSLVELRRLPILFVFDTRDAKKCVDELQEISTALTKHSITDIGIYFRLSNADAGKQFNEIIAQNQYNKELTLTTSVVGVQTTKIPKFMLTTDWRPMTVISIDHSLKHTKTAVYANCCDLVISYTENEPLIERYTWE